MGVDRVVVTGGEPLLQQRRLVPFLEAAAERGLGRRDRDERHAGARRRRVAGWSSGSTCRPSWPTAASPPSRRSCPAPSRRFAATGKAAFKFVVTEPGRPRRDRSARRRPRPRPGLGHARGHDRRRRARRRPAPRRRRRRPGAGTSRPGCTSCSGATSGAAETGDRMTRPRRGTPSLPRRRARAGRRRRRAAPLGRSFRWLMASSWVTNTSDGIALAAGPLLVASETSPGARGGVGAAPAAPVRPLRPLCRRARRPPPPAPAADRGEPAAHARARHPRRGDLVRRGEHHRRPRRHVPARHGRDVRRHHHHDAAADDGPQARPRHRHARLLSA